jgi:23S rRNA (uracil1939-C5)-methyltransferase
LGEGGHLVDAYAGVGLFGATVGADRRARVTSIESDPSANDDARVNLAELDAVVVEGEVGRWRPAPGDPAVDVVVADPARTGLGRPGVAAVVAAAAPRIVLVSCDPASLARDARLLADAGYDAGAVSLVDAFPDTFHVEAVTRFDRR